MATPQARSCNNNLKRGMTDGAYKNHAIHRGGVIEGTSTNIRREMAGVWHGFHELQVKCLPDGRPWTDPDYQDVTPQDPENV